MDRERTEGAEVANAKPAEYEIVPFPRMRHLVIDLLRAAHPRHISMA